MSDNMPTEIAASLVKAQAHSHGVQKAAQDKNLNRYYASMDQIIAEARSALAEAGLGLLAEGWYTETVDEQLHVVCTFLLVHSSGASWRTSEYRTPVVVTKGMPPDKAVASALTYTQGYAERALLNLPRVERGMQPDERDDTNYDPQQQRRGNGGARRQQRSQQQARQQSAEPEIDQSTGEVITRTRRWKGGAAGVDIRELDTETLMSYRDTVAEWESGAPSDKAPMVKAHREAVEAEIDNRMQRESAAAESGDGEAA